MALARLLGFLPFCFSTVLAQTSDMSQTTRDRINFNGMTIPATGVLYGVAGDPGQLIGTAYLDSTWQRGTVQFYGRLTPTTDSLAGLPMRYNGRTHTLELRPSPTDLRAARAESIRQFRVSEAGGRVRQYRNVREYRGDADRLSDFFEEVVPGRLTLLCHPTIYLKRATYNVALNTGSKDDVLLPKIDWYVGQNGQATRLTTSRKALLALMADRQALVDEWLRTHNPDLKTRDGLSALFVVYNSQP
ncbi:hypothetical protein [Spirosoma luteolum]